MRIIETLTKNRIFHEQGEIPYVRMTPEAIAKRNELNTLIETGKVAFEGVPCLCGKEEFDLIASYDRFGIKQKMTLCRTCGLVQSNPRMTKEATDWFYGSDFYGNLYGRIDGKATKEFILSEAKARPQARYEFVKNNLDYSKIKSVLEIGCAGGWSLLPYFNDGKKVVGYDYGPALVEAGRRLGMDLRVGKIEDDPHEHGTYDLIMMCHVFEHFPKPFESMKTLEKYLAPGGHFYIEVPDMKELAMSGIINAHSYYYTKATFLHYLGRMGFSPVSYQNDSRELSSQAGIFRKSTPQDTVPSLSGEYMRMKTLIEKADSTLTRRQKIKTFAKKISVFKALSYGAHLIRKTKKRPAKLETASIN